MFQLAITKIYEVAKVAYEELKASAIELVNLPLEKFRLSHISCSSGISIQKKNVQYFISVYTDSHWPPLITDHPHMQVFCEELSFLSSKICINVVLQLGITGRGTYCGGLIVTISQIIS